METRSWRVEVDHSLFNYGYDEGVKRWEGETQQDIWYIKSQRFVWLDWRGAKDGVSHVRKQRDKSVTRLSKLLFHSLAETNISPRWEERGRSSKKFSLTGAEGNSQRLLLPWWDERSVCVYLHLFKSSTPRFQQTIPLIIFDGEWHKPEAEIIHVSPVHHCDEQKSSEIKSSAASHVWISHPSG